MSNFQNVWKFNNNDLHMTSMFAKIENKVQFNVRSKPTNGHLLRYYFFD